ncbi:diphthamide synthesis protein, partial [Candidatus Woesearchaeota archaeon]|nr:diphthamide synthesis protein [Candidatus Woesearchaeota archaeon]
KYEGDLVLPQRVLKRLPSRLVLATPVQFLAFQEEIKRKLEENGKEVILFKSRHGKSLGQILGCDVSNFPGDYDAFLYVGDGKFHPTALLYANQKPVYCYNPFIHNIHKLELLDQKYSDKIVQRKKWQLAKFLASKRIGIIVTTKPGQSQSRVAEELRDKLEKTGKQVFFFLGDGIDYSQLENFNFVDVWINTACPRMVEDFKCLNIQDLNEVGF